MRGINVLTAQEDGMEEADDPELLDRATSLQRVLFSQDQDLLVETSRRLSNGIHFSGLIFLRQHRISAGQTIADLELICNASDPADLANWIEYLPLK